MRDIRENYNHQFSPYICGLPGEWGCQQYQIIWISQVFDLRKSGHVSCFEVGEKSWPRSRSVNIGSRIPISGSESFQPEDPKPEPTIAVFRKILLRICLGSFFHLSLQSLDQTATFKSRSHMFQWILEPVGPTTLIFAPLVSDLDLELDIRFFSWWHI